MLRLSRNEPIGSREGHKQDFLSLNHDGMARHSAFSDDLGVGNRDVLECHGDESRDTGFSSRRVPLQSGSLFRLLLGLSESSKLLSDEI